MKEINLEEILLKEIDKLREDFNDSDLYSSQEIKNSREFKYFINAMKEACKQTLELAAENAYVDNHCKTGCYMESDDFFVNKQSILNTIEQIK